MARANPGFHSTTIGEVVVTALNDGQFEAATALITGLPAQTSEALLRDSFRVLPPRFTVSCFLLEFAGRRVLVDFGTGGLYGAVLGHAPTRLAALGVAPNSIDTVLLTHGHPDHVGGLVDAAGAAVFARAELVVNATEAAFWTGEPRADNGDPARRALSAYAARLRHAADGEAVLPGITLHQFAGHTPGHSGYRIEFGRPVAADLGRHRPRARHPVRPPGGRRGLRRRRRAGPRDPGTGDGHGGDRPAAGRRDAPRLPDLRPRAAARRRLCLRAGRVGTDRERAVRLTRITPRRIPARAASPPAPG